MHDGQGKGFESNNAGCVGRQSRGGQEDEQSGPPFQISKAGWDYERIARRAYELYEQRGRQEGRDVEDWVKAEQQLAGEAGK